MRVIKNIGFAIILAIAFNSCFTAPTYPVVPQIEIVNEELYFGKSPDGGLDSISISIRFKDGDGDLGLSENDPNDSYVPYNQQQYFFKSDTDERYPFPFSPPNFWVNGVRYPLNYIVGYKSFYWLSLKSDNSSIPDVSNWARVAPVNFNDKRINPKFADLPNFVPPYNCTNWEIQRNSNDVVTDTLYIELSANYYNIFIDFEIKNPNGTFTKFDPSTFFKYPNCSVQGFNARFPILSKDLGKKSPLDGKLTYALKSLFFEALFSIKTIRMVITIQDRALNKSNSVTTKEFTLAGITKKG